MALLATLVTVGVALLLLHVSPYHAQDNDMARLPQDTINLFNRRALIRLDIEGMDFKTMQEKLVDYMDADEELDTEELRKFLSEEYRA